MRKYLIWAGVGLLVILLFGKLIVGVLAFVVKLVLWLLVGAALVVGAFYLVRWVRAGLNEGRFRRFR